MDGFRSRHETPRKMSLRRKRSIKTEGNGESPVHKKTSPSSTRTAIKKECMAADEKEKSADDDFPEDNKSQVYRTRRLTAMQNSPNVVGFKTPKNLIKRSRSREKGFGSGSNAVSDLEEQRNHQHSPDTPFVSSQLCGTQECEVVWDCNSPGFSKDDLKRMSGEVEGEEGLSPAVPVFVAPVPHRALFPKTRARFSSNTTNVNTTAQLDELLSQLTAKGNLPATGNGAGLVNASSSCESQDLSPKRGTSLVSDKLLLPLSPPADDFQLSNSPPNPPDIVLNAASQPFDFDGECGEAAAVEAATNDGSASNSNQLDPGMLLGASQDDCMNTAVCDFDDIDGISDSQSTVPYEPEDKKDQINDSHDIFDDDYFNDSLIESTQKWEKEILEKEARSSTFVSKSLPNSSDVKDKLHNTNIRMNSGSLSSFRSDKVKLNGTFEKTSGGVQVRSGISSQISKNLSSDVNKRLTTDIGCSPVIGKTRVSPIDKGIPPPQRKVRNTFRLDFPVQGNPISQNHNVDNSTHASNKGKTVNNSIHASNKSKTVHGNILLSRSLLNSNVSKSSSNRLDSHSNVNKSSSSKLDSQSICASKESDLVSNPILPKTKTFTLGAEFPKVPCQKALFNGGSTDSGKMEKARSLFPRSQSTGNAQVAGLKSSSMSRPSKSEDGEGSREFEEDDSIFESLLSTLPEDELFVSALESSEVPALSESKIKSTSSLVTNVNRTISVKNILSTSSLEKDFSARGQSKSVAKGPVKNPVNQANDTGYLSRNNPENTQGKRTSSFVQQQNVIPAAGREETLSTKRSSVRSGSSVEHSQKSDRVSVPSNVSTGGVSKKSLPGDMLDDDLFEDDVLSIIDEVESQFGSQPQSSKVASSSQATQFSQQSKCSSDEIARKKEEAQRRRREKLKMEAAGRKNEVTSIQKNEGPVRATETCRRKIEDAQLPGMKERMAEEQVTKWMKEGTPYQREEENKQKMEDKVVRGRMEESQSSRVRVNKTAEQIRQLHPKEEKQDEMTRRKLEEAQNLRDEGKKNADEIARKREEAQRRRDEKQRADAIARKREEALRRREERLKSYNSQHY